MIKLNMGEYSNKKTIKIRLVKILEYSRFAVCSGNTNVEEVQYRQIKVQNVALEKTASNTLYREVRQQFRKGRNSVATYLFSEEIRFRVLKYFGYIMRKAKI